MAEGGYVVGGIYVIDFELTRSWGVEPGSAQVTGVKEGSGQPSVQVGHAIVLSFSGLTFHGVVSSLEVDMDRQNGEVWVFSVVDNRIRLKWSYVFGQWNMEEDPLVEHSAPYEVTSPANFKDEYEGDFPSVDFTARVPSRSVLSSLPLDQGSAKRGRLFSHILPSRWVGQARAFSAKPKTAMEILREAFHGSLDGSGFKLVSHPALNEPMFGVDANSGMSQAALLSQVLDTFGLQVKLEGSRTLEFERRGSGMLTIPPEAELRKDGIAMSSEATKVRVVGGQTLVQLNEVPLEPDWALAWQDFFVETDWLAEVHLLNKQAGPVQEDAKYWAETAAKAREMTLRTYLKLKGIDVSSSSVERLYWLDHGKWGGISRMDMPVWAYLNNIVFRSYRVKKGSTLYGVPMATLDLHDQLLCAVELRKIGDDMRSVYSDNPVEYYPQSSAFVVAKGQPVDLLAAMENGAVIPKRLSDLRDQWTEISDFTLHPPSKSIRFSSPLFLDGDPTADQSVLSYPNRGQAGRRDLTGEVDEGSTYLDIAIPNPNYRIEIPEVRASLVFKLGRFYRDYGSGPRWTVHQVSGLEEHLLHAASQFSDKNVKAYGGDTGMPEPPKEGFLEILHEDGSTAIEQADLHAKGIIARPGLERSGEYFMYGTAGTILNGAINRITVRLSRQDGMVETVEMAKPRSSRGFLSSKEVSERLRNEEMFGGQKDLAKEVKQLRAIAAALRLPSSQEKSVSATHGFVPDVFRKPMGVDDSDVRCVPDPGKQYPKKREGDVTDFVGWKAGDLVWLDEKDRPSREGKKFGGVVVIDKKQDDETASGGFVSVALAGIVPVAVRGGTPVGAVMANPGDPAAGSSGSVVIGTLAHGVPVPSVGGAVPLAMVRLGGGAGVKPVPLYILPSRPSYIPPPPSPPAAGSQRYWIEWGTLQGLLADNWSAHHDLSSTTYFFAKAKLRTTGGLKVLSWEILTGSQQNSHETPDWPVGAPRPAYLVVLLGSVLVQEGVHTIIQNGGGSILVSEHLSDIQPGSEAGEVKLQKELTYQRITY